MLVLGHHQQSDTATHKHSNVKNDIRPRHFLQRSGAHAVQGSVENGHGCHDSHGLVVGRDIREARAHRNGCQQQLSAAILGRGNSCDLTQEIQPATQPADFRNPSLRREILACEV